jgi:putative ABC transport system permease protein
VRSLARNKPRTALSTLGIAVGVAAVVWVVAIGTAGSARAEAQLLALGDNLVWVEAGSRTVNGLRTGTHNATTLTLEDEQAIRAQVPAIKRVSPQIDGSVVSVYGDHNWTTRYRGVAPEYLEIKRWEIGKGAVFSEDMVDRAASVCVIGQTVRAQLFGEEEPIGRVIRLGSQPFEVIGVLSPKGQSATGQDQDDTIMLPYTTAQKKLRGGGIAWLDDILCSAQSPADVGPASEQITDLMRQRHHIDLDEDDDFNIRHPEEVVNAQLEASRTFSLLLTSIALVALLVGGIGVMNVMLASVVERTREIGVRLAVGASSASVQLQFLIEAVALTSLGGLFGVALSFGGGFAIGRWVGWDVPIPMLAVVLAVAFSVAIGVFFGFYPAWRAARLDPIEALRSD